MRIMKKTIYTMAIALMASAALMTACNKEEQGQKFILSVQQPAGAKTTIGSGHSTLWKTGDKVYINGTELTVTTDGVATYAVSENTIQAYEGHKYYAFYAGNAALTEQELHNTSASYTYTMPSTITIATSELQAPMAAVATGTDQSVDVEFYNLCMLLDVSGLGKTACDITIEETDPENNGPLYGTFTTTNTGEGWASTCNTTAEHGYTLTVKKTTQNDLVSIPLPAGNHKLKISVSAFQKEMNVSFNFQASHYYDVQMQTKPIEPVPYGDFYFGTGNVCAYKDADWASIVQSTTTIYRLEQNQWDTTTFQSNGTSGVTVARTGVIVWLGTDITGNPGSIDPGSLNSNGSSGGTMPDHAYGHLIEGGVTAEAAHWWCPSPSEWKQAIGGFSQPSTNAVADQSTSGRYPNGSSNQRWAYVKIQYTDKDSIQGHNYTESTPHVIGGLMFIPTLAAKTAVAPYVPTTNLNWGTTYTYYGSTEGRNNRIFNNGWLNVNNENGTYTCNNIPILSAEEFKVWESAGAVFLPAYGATWHTGNAGTWYANGDGLYRTNALNGNKHSWVLYFDPCEPPSILSSNGHGQHLGMDNGSACAVRLIYRPTTTTNGSSKSADSSKGYSAALWR